MKDLANGVGEYSSSPTGQGCLWVAALGVMGILAFSYVSAYSGVPHDPLDRVENGIAGVTRPTAASHPTVSSRHRLLHAHRTQRRHRVASRSKDEAF